MIWAVSQLKPSVLLPAQNASNALFPSRRIGEWDAERIKGSIFRFKVIFSESEGMELIKININTAISGFFRSIDIDFD